MRAADPLVVTFLYPAELPAETEAILSAVAPVEVHSIPFVAPSRLRSIRSASRGTERRAAIPELSINEWAVLERSQVVVALDLPDALLERARSLRWVQAVGAGTEHLDAAALARHGVVLTNAAGVASSSIAEFVIGRLLQVWKQFRRLDVLQNERVWKPTSGRRVAGLTLGIVGLGAIGRAVARRARAFEMQVLASRRSARAGDRDPDVDELFTIEALDMMLSRCDAVVVSAPATDQTNGLFDDQRLAAMKPGAVLCNVARGSLVDEPALVRALESGHLAAAVLDVTAAEPTPPTSPLWSAPNCYLSPHSATALEGYADAIVELVARNLDRYVRGEPLQNTVATAT